MIERTPAVPQLPLIAVALLTTIAAGVARGADTGTSDDGPAAVPYRPSVSTPSALSAPGWLEVEAGLQHQHDGRSAHRDSLPVTLKLAFTPDWGVRVGSDAWVRSRDGSQRDSGFGDTGIVVKRRFAVDEQQAFGLEVGVVVPTARSGLGSGSGKADYGINAIYSADFGDVWHTDLNATATRLGAVDAGSGRVQWAGAASLSRSFDAWGVVGEISGSRRSGEDSSRQLLGALSYSVSKRLVIDVGVARSLRSGPPQWSAFAGFTWLAARLF